MTERFISPAPPPTPHERELTEILIEECAEVQQRATKLLRFGPVEIQPGQPFNNACRLALEIGDLLEIIDRARLAGLILPGDIEIGRQKKREQLAKYMQTTPATISPTQDTPAPDDSEGA